MTEISSSTPYDNMFGRVVHMSADGNTMIDTHYNATYGRFHIFNYNSSTNTWDRDNTTPTYGAVVGGYFGNLGSGFSGDGNVIAGIEQKDYWGCNIFKKVSGSWIQIGVLEGNSSNDFTTPSLNYDGTRIVVRMRTPNHKVRVYAYSGADVASTSQAAFSQVGSDISNPNTANHYHESTSINKAGDIIAFGSYYDSDIRMYRYNNATSDWVQHGSFINLGINTYIGHGYTPNQAIRLNDDGDMVLFGSISIGKAYVYKYTERPLGINGYYPLYTTAQLASNASPDGSGYHSHDISNNTTTTTYYMPNGLNMNASNGPITQWHGDYSPSSSPFAVNGYYPCIQPHKQPVTQVLIILVIILMI